MIRHLVLFTFRPDLGNAQLNELLVEFAALKQKTGVVLSFEAGTNNSPEGLAQGYSHGFVLTFADAAGREIYLHHPAHVAFVERVKPQLTQALVFDFEVGPGAGA
jgi:hypothetical protein